MTLSYQVGFPNNSIEKQFEKSLRKMPKDYQAKVVEAVRALAHNPRPEGKKIKKLTTPLTVFSFVAQYRLRVGDYRVLYDIDDRQKKVILLGLVRRTTHTY